MAKPHKLSYLPGILQLTVIPFILSYAGVKNFYFLNSFRIFDNFNPYTDIKILKISPLLPPPSNCTYIITRRETLAFTNIQRAINLKSSFPEAITLPEPRDIEILRPCFELSIYSTQIDKYKYYTQGKIINERLIWTTKQKK